MADDTVDHEVLAKLATDVGPEATVAMIDLFLQSLPQRVRRLRAALGEGDVEEVHVAALSLSSSAAMLGAGPLAAATIAYLRAAALPGSDLEFAGLAQVTCAELRRRRQVLLADGGLGTDMCAAGGPCP